MSGSDPLGIGLCATCRHARVVSTPRSHFLLCERSRGDSSYERYPRLPVITCRGHEPAGAGESEADDAAPGTTRDPEK